MKKITNPKLVSFFNYIVLILGATLVGISVGSVLLPSKLSTGGFTGVATILHYLFNIPASIVLPALNIPIFILVWKVVGFQYAVKSLIGMFFCSLGIKVGETFGVLTSEPILAAIYGGILSGLGIGLTYRVGGSTGGTDLVAKLVQVKKPHLNLSEILLIVDGIVIGTSAILFNSIEIALYSIVALYVMTKVLDLVLIGADYSKAVFIITNKDKEISDYMHNVLERTTTKIKAVGTYTNAEKSILLCVVNKKEIPKLKECILEIDDKAFTIITGATDAYGKGFKELE